MGIKNLEKKPGKPVILLNLQFLVPTLWSVGTIPLSSNDETNPSQSFLTQSIIRSSKTQNQENSLNSSIQFTSDSPVDPFCETKFLQHQDSYSSGRFSVSWYWIFLGRNSRSKSKFASNKYNFLFTNNKHWQAVFPNDFSWKSRVFSQKITKITREKVQNRGKITVFLTQIP